MGLGVWGRDGGGRGGHGGGGGFWGGYLEAFLPLGVSGEEVVGGGEIF